MSDETLLRSHGLRTNIGKLIREDTLDGRKYIVAPVVLITEGVHNNVLYTAAELSKHTDAWNGRPLVAPSHPTVNGRPVTANSKRVLEKMEIGKVLNVNWDAGSKKLRGEAWFDKEKTEAKCPKVLAELEKDAPQVEVSTGLFTDDTMKANVFGNKQYACEAKNHRPDHLAVLIGGKGACSWEDGAGLPRINAAMDDDDLDDDDLDELTVNAEPEAAEEEDPETCPDCGGELVDGVCPECDGKAYVEEPKENAETEGGRWVTMSGTPVFIKDGEDPKDALARHTGNEKPGGQRGANVTKANKPIEADTAATAVNKLLSGLKPSNGAPPFSNPNRQLLVRSRAKGDAGVIGTAYRRAWLAGDRETGAKIEAYWNSTTSHKQNSVMHVLTAIAEKLGIVINKKVDISAGEKAVRVSKALSARYNPVPPGSWSPSVTYSCAPSPWLRDLFDGYVVYEMYGKTFKLSLSWDNGQPEFEGEPVEVVQNTEWVPKNNSDDKWVETEGSWEVPGWEAAK